MSVLSVGALLALLCVSLVASFVFSGSETGLISINPLRLRHAVEAGNRGARLLSRLVDRREQTMVAVLIGNNLALVVATVASVTLLERGLLQVAWLAPRADRVAQFLTPLVLTPIILFGCEILPKSIFRVRPIALTRLTAPILEGFRWVSAPVGFLVTRLMRVIVRGMTGDPGEDGPLVSREELIRLFALGEAGGSLEADEHEMIQGIIDLGHRSANAVMVPRTQVKMAKNTATCAELYDMIEQEGHSRIPVYADRVDTVVGMIYARDLLAGQYEESAPITDIIRPVLHVPESMRLDDLLREMRTQHRSVVIVVDEHGGMAGILTLEDVIEEIVGEIRDEYDADEAPEFRRLPDGSYLVAATMSLEDVNDELQLRLPDTGVVETLGGFLVHLQGRIPRAGEMIVAAGVQFHVVAATDRAVQRVRVRPPATPKEPTP